MPKSTITSKQSPSALNDSSQKLLKEFNQILGVDWVIPGDLQQVIFPFLENVELEGNKNIRKNLLVASINKKFKINKKIVQSLINDLAKKRIFLSFEERKNIQLIFDNNEKNEYLCFLKERNLSNVFLESFPPADKNKAINYFKAQLDEATINRSDARKGVQLERKNSIFRSVFCSWLFNIGKREDVYSYNLGVSKKDLFIDYFEYLGVFHKNTIDRSCGAYSVLIDKSTLEKEETAKIENIAFKEIINADRLLSNYSNLFFVIEIGEESSYGKAWEIAHSITLFAERFKESTLKTGFFRPEKIRDATSLYIKNLNEKKADFYKYQHGFFFKDCFVKTAGNLTLQEKESDVKYIILSFDKKVADESPLPCPACRSTNVRGNSYPSLGVKSWECQNPICPERSAFNRGNRFSPLGIIRDESLKNTEALIPDESLSKWKLDVLKIEDKFDIFDMIVRHYSFPNDKLIFRNFFKLPKSHIGRSIDNKILDESYFSDFDIKDSFKKSSFFHRYLKVKNKKNKSSYYEVKNNNSWLKLYKGSCIDVLQNLEKESMDSAITSPPYYNAKEYSQWDNIYCYLYDMNLSAEYVFRALKPGGYYLFNIFDNFDNDNIVALSDMGKRRLTLGAYMTDIFKNCGFDVYGNIVWYKGEIEGKRNYNNGKKTPYLQLPLNTWEHILVLRKPGNVVNEINFPNSVYIRPVLKWIKGENRHGHTAPYPLEIPEILCSRLPKNSNILDPFAGSLTTALACRKNKQNCMAIELHQSYCDLGLEIIDKHLATGCSSE